MSEGLDLLEVAHALGATGERRPAAEERHRAARDPRDEGNLEGFKTLLSNENIKIRSSCHTCDSTLNIESTEEGVSVQGT